MFLYQFEPRSNNNMQCLNYFGQGRGQGNPKSNQAHMEFIMAFFNRNSQKYFMLHDRALGDISFRCVIILHLH